MSPRRSLPECRSGTISPPPTKRQKTRVDSDIEPRVSPKPQSDVSIYSWNVNGIATFLQSNITSWLRPSTERLTEGVIGSEQANLRAFLKRNGWPTMVCLQEVKINPDDQGSMRAVSKAVAKGTTDGPGYVARFCLPSDQFNARGFGRKVYGVCSIIREDFLDQSVERVREVSWDSEGRFLVTETKESGGSPKLAIINVYAVNGTENPYRSPVTGSVTGTRHDRKLEVHRLLRAEVRDLEARGYGVIIAGDINIARSTLDGHPNLRTFPPQHCVNRANFESAFFSNSMDPDDAEKDSLPSEMVRSESSAMIDTFRHLHPTEKAYTYYPRSVPFGASCDRVDMIITSSSLAEHLTEAGMLATPADRGPSDHVPLYAKFAFPR